MMYMLVAFQTMLPSLSAELAVTAFLALIQGVASASSYSHPGTVTDDDWYAPGFWGHIDGGMYEMNDGVSHASPQHSNDASYASPDLFDTTALSDQLQTTISACCQ
eukprot:8970089-Karenia_brevis.AAC.1